METIDNPFEKHQQLIAYLILSHMSSFSINGYLTSTLAYSKVLRTEIAGPLNDKQREFLDIINHNTNRLSEHLNVFITASRLIFTPERIYHADCNLLDIIDQFVKRTEQTTNFQIATELPESIPLFKADENLIHHSIESIGRIIKQVHPTHKGQIKIMTEVEGDFVRIIFSTNKDESVYLVNENPDLFIAQAVAKLHGGTFVVDTSNEDRCDLIFTLSTTKLL